MTTFTLNHKNRYQFPIKEILVVEDDLLQQAKFAKHFVELLGHQSNCVVTFMPSAVSAFAYLKGMQNFTTGNGALTFAFPCIVILDHDLQHGDGAEFLSAIRSEGINTPVITASGIPQNNERLMRHGATYEFVKSDVIAGKADAIIMNAIGDSFLPCPGDWVGHI